MKGEKGEKSKNVGEELTCSRRGMKNFLLFLFMNETEAKIKMSWSEVPLGREKDCDAA